MRLVSVLCLMALCISSVAMADPANVEPKDWSFNLQGREIIPEQEPNDTCPGQQMACGDVIEPGYLDPSTFDWFQFEVAVAGTWLTIGIDSYNGSSWDSYLELYADDCTTMIASDDDSGPGLFSLISNFVTTYAGTYNIKVRGFGSGGGDYRMFVTCSEPIPPPENDTCDGAIPIEPCTSGTIVGDLTYATNDYSPTNGCTGYSANSKDVVYLLAATAGDIIDITYTTPEYDGSIYILSDCGDMNSCVIGEDDPEPEHFVWNVGSTGTYYLIADGYSTNAGGPFTIDFVWTCTVPPTEEACCFPDGSCQMLLADRCIEAGGEPMGEGTTCDTVYCEIVPANQTTWGQIRSNYR